MKPHASYLSGHKLHADLTPPNVHGPYAPLISLVELYSAVVIVTKVFVQFDLLLPTSVIIALSNLST